MFSYEGSGGDQLDKSQLLELPLVAVLKINELAAVYQAYRHSLSCKYRIDNRSNCFIKSVICKYCKIFFLQKMYDLMK